MNNETKALISSISKTIAVISMKETVMLSKLCVKFNLELEEVATFCNDFTKDFLEKEKEKLKVEKESNLHEYISDFLIEMVENGREEEAEEECHLCGCPKHKHEA